MVKLRLVSYETTDSLWRGGFTGVLRPSLLLPGDESRLERCPDHLILWICSKYSHIQARLGKSLQSSLRVSS